MNSSTCLSSKNTYSKSGFSSLTLATAAFSRRDKSRLLFVWMMRLGMLEIIFRSRASIMGSATLCSSRWTQRRRRQFHRCQNRRQHRARLLTEKALRSRRPLRPCEEKVVHGGEAASIMASATPAASGGGKSTSAPEDKGVGGSRRHAKEPPFVSSSPSSSIIQAYHDR